MARHLLVGLALVVALMVGYPILSSILTSPEGAPARADGSTFRTAPEFTLAGTNQSTIRLSDYRGKVVLLDFWATWCGGCKVEIPWFIEFEDKYKDRGLAVLGVSLDAEGWDVVQPFLESHNVNYPVVLADTLFGLSHLASGQFFALDATTGKTLWLGPPREAKNTAVVKAGDLLFLLNDDAELIVARSSRTGFEPLKRYTVADSPTWAQPAISGNRILVKDVSSLTLWSLD
jgi:peroxiredoxin